MPGGGESQTSPRRAAVKVRQAQAIQMRIEGENLHRSGTART
jgi:hypothetical protein